MITVPSAPTETDSGSPATLRPDTLSGSGPPAGEAVTEQQLRSLFGERGGHPYADRIEADLLAAGPGGGRDRPTDHREERRNGSRPSRKHRRPSRVYNGHWPDT
ncbi:hypothetical protein EYS09_04210 [Streptomyces kasugaensis]|uniref:Uncharacterized protein n=1 Tax=Streptomyces kasugaensis TaxID=1946 RepID=A0A4Q9HZX2_STRKA|nr:hypothetical protein EYS09_04210 [Streptomyces kasugaensis]